jgi:purine-binding chemotaxis protein CheW
VIANWVCAFDLHDVAEVMRPLPTVPLTGMPEWTLGLSLIRGAPLPVVDMRRLLGHPPKGTPERYAVMNAGERRVALAVDRVIGIRWLEASALDLLPPLLRQAGEEVVAALGTVDRHLLMVLEVARVLPGEFWQRFDSQEVQ